MSTVHSVVVVGGGISGLTTAWWLKRAGVDVVVLEKELWPGGTMRTIREDGWLVETGPNSALETTPLFSQMFEELGILKDRLYANPASDKRYILRGGTLHPLPMSPGAFLLSPLWTMKGKLRLLKEPFVGRATGEETIAQFVERRLGREFLDYAINPFVAGVYAGNPEQLSVRAAFPKLYALEEKYGGLVKGMVKGARERKRRAEKAKDRAKMFSFGEGMQTFPTAIAGRLGDCFVTGCSSLAINRAIGNGQRIFQIDYRREGGDESVQAYAVIVAVPASAASVLLKELSPSLAQMLDGIYYPPVAEVFLGFKESQVGIDLEGFGYLIPAKEQRKILGTIWSSSLFPNRAPARHVALTTFVGGSRQPELPLRDDRELISLVTEEIQALMGVKGQAVYAKVLRWQKAIPQYNLGYHEVIEAIERFEMSEPGLFLCGNYRGGIAVGDCIMSGEQTASRVKALLDKNITTTSISIGA